MKLIVTDTNIFFDLISVGALPEFFNLKYEICTTVFVIQEIIRSDQKDTIDAFIRAKKVIVIEFSAKEIEEIQRFNTHKPYKGITDKSVLWKSHQLDCPLLTGDKKLRKEAQELGIEVHGSIWVIVTLVESGQIDKTRGIELLRLLKKSNASLPFDEIDKLIRNYKK